MNISNQHPFDQATALVRTEDGKYAGRTNTDYANVVGTFGGTTAATLMRAVMESEARQGEPISQTVNFCGSIGEGDFEISTQVERAGKYTQHWSLKLSQQGEVKTTSTIVCGSRSDVFESQLAIRPSAPDAEKCEPLATKGLINWLERYTFRFAEGPPSLTGVPLSKNGSTRSILWVNDAPDRTVDILSVASMADCFFPRLLHLRGKMVPFGTVSMTTYFHATLGEIATIGAQPLLGAADANRIHQNFHDQQMQLWASGDNLIATGSQLVWYKE